jgi:hypothetical protein
MATHTPSKAASARTKTDLTTTIDAKLDHAAANLEYARQEFLDRENVIGVGFGFKESGGRVLRDTPAILVFVEEKKDRAELAPAELIPSHFAELPTDVN